MNVERVPLYISCRVSHLVQGREDDTKESEKEEAFIFLPKPVNNAKPDNRIQLRQALQVLAFPIRGECIPIPHTRE